MTDEILALNSNNELVAKDPATGNTRPIQVSDLSASSRLNLDDGALLTLGSNDDFGLRYDATADSFVVADNTNGTDTVTVDRTTGDIDTVGDVSATNVSADTQMNSSSTRPNIFADDVNANSLTGVSTGGVYQEDSNSPFQANGSDIDAQLSQSYDHVIGLISSTLTGRVGTNNCGLSVNGGNNTHDYIDHSGTEHQGTSINLGRLQSVAGRFTLTRRQRESLAFSSQLGQQTNINFHAEYGKVEEPDISSIQLFDRSNNSNDIGLQLRVFFA